MKINEVINEGLLDNVRGYQTQRAAKKAAGPALALELADWKKFAAQRGPIVDMRNPEEFRKQLQTWSDSRYPSSKDQVDINQVVPNNQRSIDTYITNRFNTAMANRAAGVTASTTQPAQPEQSTQSEQPPNWSDLEQPAVARREKSVSKPEYHPSSTAPIDPTLLGSNQLHVAGHGIITKGPDNKWRDEQDDVIVRPEDISELERRLLQKQQTQQMAPPQPPFRANPVRQPRSTKKGRKR